MTPGEHISEALGLLPRVAHFAPIDAHTVRTSLGIALDVLGEEQRVGVIRRPELPRKTITAMRRSLEEALDTFGSGWESALADLAKSKGHKKFTSAIEQSLAFAKAWTSAHEALCRMYTLVARHPLRDAVVSG